MNRWIGRLALLAALLLPAAAQGTISADNGEVLIIPAQSPVKLAQKSPHVTAYTFNGDVVITGTYHYGYLGSDGEAYDEDLSLYIDPDPGTIDHLPYWQTLGRAKHIWVKNHAAFAAEVLPPQVVADIAAKKARSASGRVAIVADKYTASIDCDAASYMVRYVRLHKPATTVASLAFTGYAC